MADAESAEVLNAILSPAPPAGEAGGEAAPRPGAAPSRGADGRFAPADQADPEEIDEQPAEAVAEGQEQEPEEQEQPEEEAEEQAAPENLDEYTLPVSVDGKTMEVPIGELKRAYSGAKYVERNIQQAVEYRKASETAASQAYNVLEQQVQHLEAFEQVWSKFTTLTVNLDELRVRDPQAYAVERVKLVDAQERVQKIQQEISARREQQAKIMADAKARRVEDETRTLLQKLPALADPQKAPVVMGKIYEVAQSYGVAKEEVDQLDGHIPVLVLAELAWRREQMSAMDARLKRPTGDMPRPKTLIRPGTAKPAQAPQKRLQAEILNRARRTGKPDDVAATLLVARKKA